MKEKITRSSGNVFADLGFPPEEAVILAMRADMMAQLRLTIEKRNGRRPRRPRHWESASHASPTSCAANGTNSASTCW